MRSTATGGKRWQEVRCRVSLVASRSLVSGRDPCAAVKAARGRMTERSRLAGQSHRHVLLRLPRSEAMGGRVEVIEPR